MSQKPLRFAALIRVSTEQQERQGESLRTQRTSIERDVRRLAGSIAGWYGGQEHGTPGWEKKEVDRLVADAIKGKFQAVVVTTTDRWSRDNASSKDGLETLRKHGIRFFVGSMEMDLFDPQHWFILGMNAEVGEFIARQQSKKSIENRIERAKRGVPTGGKIPFGRIWENDRWSLLPEKVALIQKVAARYLAGESLPKLAREFGVNHANLCKVLRERCGPSWEIEFNAPSLNIRETVKLAIPPLLPEDTIKAVKRRLEANRTYLHGTPKHDYLLAGRVFCAECGYSFFGQTNHPGRATSHRYYRHAHNDGAKKCSLHPRPWVRSDELESVVVSKLVNLLGNPAAIERAIKACIPDCDEALGRKQALECELAKIERARERVLDLVVKDSLTDAQAEKKLGELKQREAGLRTELETLESSLANLPDPEAIRVFVDRSDDGTVMVHDEEGNVLPGGNYLSTLLTMGADDRRTLVAKALSGTLPDGSPAGIYLKPTGDRRFRRFSFEFRGLLREGMRYASYSPGTAPPAPRSGARTLPRGR